MKLVQILREWIQSWQWRKPGTYPDQLRAFAARPVPRRGTSREAKVLENAE